MGWLFLTALERVTEERDALQHCWDKLGDELWDALKKERKLLRTGVMLLRDMLVMREEAAGKSELQEAVG